MKLKSLLLSMVAAISFSVQAEVVWTPIQSYSYPGTKAFVDADATRTMKAGNKEYVQAFILITADKPFEIIVGTEKMTARSSVKLVVVECREATVTPVTDFYFSQEKPKDSDTPLAQTAPGPRGTAKIPKSNFLYVTLCAKSV